MQAAGSAEAFDGPEQVTTSSITCRVDLVVDALDFERVEEALHRGVVQAVALAAHGWRYPCRSRGLAIAVCGVLNAPVHLLSAVPGVGPTVFVTLLGELPELGTLDRRRIASLAGLAPHARESGTWRGARRIWGGRRKVREALYIAALTASRRVPSLMAMRDRMRHKGKAPKTILIAVARQLLVILNAMLRKGKPLIA